MKVSPIIKPPSLVALLEGKVLKALNLKVKEIQEEKEKEDEKRRLDILAWKLIEKRSEFLWK